MTDQPLPPDNPDRRLGPIAPQETTEGLSVSVLDEDEVDRQLAAIEMIGEESSIGFPTRRPEPLSPEVRYLHISRTINQLVSDRNRGVGILLFVSSLLIGASTALLNASEQVNTIIPLPLLQRWCFPVTFGALMMLSIFASLILIRTRVGLIYEVAKMNVLLGLPAGRVKRVNAFSIFFLMHLLVTTLGGASTGLVVGMLLSLVLAPPSATLGGISSGLVFLGFFQTLYVVMILKQTPDIQLQNASRQNEPNTSTTSSTSK